MIVLQKCIGRLSLPGETKQLFLKGVVKAITEKRAEIVNTDKQ